MLSVILDAIRRLQAEKPRLCVAIDGRCAAGKTTLAKKLQRETSCGLIHMDDFFLRPEQRTPQRLATPGGNIDHERFLREVLLPLKEGRAVSYRPFDCGTGAFGAPIRVEPVPIVIVEGSYCCHPSLWEHYDLRLFLTVSPREQMRRIALRSPEKAETFRTKWIPLEEAYFSAFAIETRCDQRCDTTEEM